MILITLFSCTKTDTLIQDDRCTNLIVNNKSTQLLTHQQMDTINYLFNKNGLNSSNIQFFEYRIYDGDKSIFQHQYVNNLKIFELNLGFRFNKDGILTSTSGRKVTGPIDVPNTPRYDLSYIRAVFVHEFENQKDWYMANYTDSTKKVIEAGCLDMELGYFKLDFDNESTMNFTRAWFVKPSDGMGPEMYIDDVTGKRIAF